MLVHLAAKWVLPILNLQKKRKNFFLKLFTKAEESCCFFLTFFSGTYSVVVVVFFVGEIIQEKVLKLFCHISRTCSKSMASEVMTALSANKPLSILGNTPAYKHTHKLSPTLPFTYMYLLHGILFVIADSLTFGLKINREIQREKEIHVPQHSTEHRCTSFHPSLQLTLRSNIHNTLQFSVDILLVVGEGRHNF